MSILPYGIEGSINPVPNTSPQPLASGTSLSASSSHASLVSSHHALKRSSSSLNVDGANGADEHYVSKRTVKSHSVLWSIESFSLCLQDEKLESPVFEFAGVKWASHIYPKGMTDLHSIPQNNYVQVFVKVIQFSTNQTLKFEIAIMDRDGNLCFTKRTPPKRLEGANQFGVCFKKFMSHEFLHDTDKYSPNDTLTVHHKIILISESETSKLTIDSRAGESYGVPGGYGFNNGLPPNVMIDYRLSTDWHKLLLSEQCVDFTINLNDEEQLLAHKAVLCARSPVFRAMLSHSNNLESNTNTININDCPSVLSFKMFLAYLYAGTLATYTSASPPYCNKDQSASIGTCSSLIGGSDGSGGGNQCCDYSHKAPLSNDNVIIATASTTGGGTSSGTVACSNQNNDTHPSLDSRLAMDLIALANKYDVPGLKYECQSFLRRNITVENAAEVLIIADMHDCSDELVKAALRFIKDNSEAVKSQPNWSTLIRQHSSIFVEHFI